MAVEAGTRIGPFLIHECLGQGDLGLVFRAQALDGGSVAVKILDRIALRNPWDRLADLTARMAGLRHPNLAAILEIGEHGGTPYVIEQYGSNGSLADHLLRACLSEAAALWVLRAVADGIDHAHRLGFVHGALNPHQVVLDAEDKPLVTDFGLAELRWPHPKGGALVTARNLGYAAPEVVLGWRPMPASDRYSFAVLACQLLAGTRAFHAGPPDRATLERNLGDGVKAVLLRGLAADHASRLEDCLGMVQALADAISAREPVPQPIPAGAPPVLSAAGLDVATGSGLAAAANGVSCASPADDRPWARWSFIAAAAAVLAVEAAASWFTGKPPQVALTVSQPVVAVGDSIELSALHLLPGQVGIVQLQPDAEQVGIFRADANGVVRTQVVIPQDAVPGEHSISLCWDGGCYGRASLTVDPPQAAQAEAIAGDLMRRKPNGG